MLFTFQRHLPGFGTLESISLNPAHVIEIHPAVPRELLKETVKRKLGEQGAPKMSESLASVLSLQTVDETILDERVSELQGEDLVFRFPQVYVDKAFTRQPIYAAVPFEGLSAGLNQVLRGMPSQPVMLDIITEDPDNAVEVPRSVNSAFLIAVAPTATVEAVEKIFKMRSESIEKQIAGLSAADRKTHADDIKAAREAHNSESDQALKEAEFYEGGSLLRTRFDCTMQAYRIREPYQDLVDRVHEETTGFSPYR
mgnify:CR=1 FL=1